MTRTDDSAFHFWAFVFALLVFFVWMMWDIRSRNACEARGGAWLPHDAACVQGPTRPDWPNREAAER